MTLTRNTSVWLWSGWGNNGHCQSLYSY